jgi:hypothetical protein
MLTGKVIRFFAKTPPEAKRASDMLTQVTRKIRSYLIARTLINLGLGLVIALGLWCLRVHFALALGLFAALTNFVPYIGQLIGGTLPTVLTLGQTGSIGDALIVAAMYLAVVGVEGYVVTPLVMGRSLDLNGTTVLIACLFWGYLRWAELMSVDWQSPDVTPADAERTPAELPAHRPVVAGFGHGSPLSHPQAAGAAAIHGDPRRHTE